VCWPSPRDKASWTERYILLVRRMEFISDRMPYLIIKDIWGDIILPDVHEPTYDNCKDTITVLVGT
jgi:hypothetical protein